MELELLREANYRLVMKSLQSLWLWQKEKFSPKSRVPTSKSKSKVKLFLNLRLETISHLLLRKSLKRRFRQHLVLKQDTGLQRIWLMMKRKHKVFLTVLKKKLPKMLTLFEHSAKPLKKQKDRKLTQLWLPLAILPAEKNKLINKSRTCKSSTEKTKLKEMVLKMKLWNLRTAMLKRWKG